MISTKKIVLIALFSALAFVLSNVVFFRMPQGGSITIYLVPLYLAAFNFDIKTNFYIAIICATLQVLIGGYILNPLQVILDYYLPVMIICCSGLIKVNKYFAIAISSVLAMFSYVLSGMIFFEVPFIPSIIYNATFFIPTVVINMILFIIINPRLNKYLK